MSFERDFLDMVRSGDEGVDLGCGRHGNQVRDLAPRCAKVIAVDRDLEREGREGNVVWIRSSIEDWLDSLSGHEAWDFFHCRLVLQFLDQSVVDRLMEEMVHRLRSGGRIYIRCWFRVPDDDFPLSADQLTLLDAAYFREKLHSVEHLQTLRFPRRAEGRYTGRRHMFYNLAVLARKSNAPRA